MPLQRSVLGQLLLKRPEYFRVRGFQLERDLVSDAASPIQSVAFLPTQSSAIQSSSFRQRMMRRGGHLTQRQLILVGPGDHVARVGDVDLDFVVTTPKCLCLADFKKFRVQGSPEKAVLQFGDFGANG